MRTLSINGLSCAKNGRFFLILWHVQRIYAQSYRTLEFSLDL